MTRFRYYDPTRARAWSHNGKNVRTCHDVSSQPLKTALGVSIDVLAELADRIAGDLAAGDDMIELPRSCLARRAAALLEGSKVSSRELEI